MAAPKSFAAILNSPEIRDAIQTLTPGRVLVFVEGETDWQWLYSMIAKNRADIRYELGNAGGVDYVLEQVHQCRQRGTRCIGIIDRDFAGLEGTRHENLVDEVFDTELHDSEIVMVDAGALALAMEWQSPPKQRPTTISDARIERLRRECLSTAAILGAVRLVNIRRRASRDLQRPIVDDAVMDAWKSTFALNGAGVWKLDIATLQAAINWNGRKGVAFATEVQAALNEARNEARFLLPDNPTAEDVEYVSGLILCNGHDLMDLMSKAWDSYISGVNTCAASQRSCRDDLYDRMRGLFDFIRFSKTRLHEKLDHFCGHRFGTSIFVAG